MSSPIFRNVIRATRPCRAQEASAFIRKCRSELRSGQRLSAKNNRPVSRPFSVSGPSRATAVTQNPRQDEEGNDMLIAISERAAKRLRHITTAAPQKNTLTSSSASGASSDSHLRVTVTSGGCHGFQYLMSLEPSDKIDSEEDTIFVSEDEAGAGKGSARVVLDESSLELLKGSTVDFTTELIGSQFKIVGNPRATSSCGCGTSFDIE